MLFRVLYTAIFVIVFSHSGNLLAQYKFTANAGLGISTFIGEDVPKTVDYKMGPTAALAFEYEINNTICMGAELILEQKGAFYEDEPREATKLKVDGKTTYISLPIMVKAYFGKKASFYFYGGFTVSKLLFSKLDYYTTEYGFEIPSEPFFNYEFKNKDVGLNIGFGFDFYNIIIDCRYTHGVEKVFDDPSAPNIRNHFLNINCGYTLYKNKVNRCFNFRTY